MSGPGAALLAGKAAHRALMLDACTIARPGARTYNAGTRGYDQAAAETVYTGPVRAKAWRGEEEQAAEGEVAVVRYHLDLPLDATVPVLQRRDVATISASTNPALTGTVLILTEPDFGTTSTALRWVAEVSR